MNDKDTNKLNQGLSWAQPQSVLAQFAKKALPTPQPDSGHRTLARHTGIFASGIVVGVLVSWGYAVVNGSRAPIAMVATTTVAAVQSAGISIDETGAAQSSFEIVSPQKAGKKVTVTRVSVSKPTWVVVYDSVGGVPGRALGAALFSAQKSSGIVSLLRATVPGKTYVVGLASDDGSGTFSPRADAPVLIGGERLLLTLTVN